MVELWTLSGIFKTWASLIGLNRDKYSAKNSDKVQSSTIRTNMENLIFLTTDTRPYIQFFRTRGSVATIMTNVFEKMTYHRKNNINNYGNIIQCLMCWSGPLLISLLEEGLGMLWQGPKKMYWCGCHSKEWVNTKIGK
jgi:hypothetical protein